MIAFALIALLMLGVGLFVVARSMVRPPAAAGESDARLAAYRNRIAELEKDINTGLVAGSEAAAMQVELERELLAAVHDSPDTGNAGSRRAAAAVVLLVPVAALGLYFYLGSPMLVDGPPEPQAVSTLDIEKMVEGLATRLEKQPDDEAGWMMLGRSYMVLGRYADAVTAIEHLHGITGDRPDVLIHLADALAMGNGGTLAGRPTELVQRVLEIDAQNQSALWLAGIAAMESGDAAAALRHWETLSPLLKPDDPGREQLDRLLAHARQAKVDASETETIPDPADIAR